MLRSVEASRRLRYALERERFKIWVVAIVGGVIWLGVTAGLVGGLRSLGIYPGFKELVVSYLVGMFFFVVMVMLFFSSAIVSYGALFSGTEVPFLLTSAVPVSDTYLYRLFFAFIFSGWAVMVMGLPVIAAYGMDNRFGWKFYVGAACVFPPFLALVAALGGAAALLLARFLGRYRRSVIGILVMLAALAAVYAAMRWPSAIRPGRGYAEEWMFRILGWFSFARSPWYPSTWAMKAVEAAAQNDWAAYSLYMYALAAGAAAALSGGRVLAELFYGRAYEVSATASARGMARFSRGLWFFCRLAAFGDRRRAAFFYKDTVSFLRDPLQWGQAAVFLGLILIYFLGIKRFGREDLFKGWRVVTASLSYLSVALTMSTFTTRFSFPLVSMELRVPWGIIGGGGARKRW